MEDFRNVGLLNNYKTKHRRETMKPCFAAVVAALLLSWVLEASMQEDDHPVLSEGPDSYLSSPSEPIGCANSTSHYVEVKGDRWFEIGPVEGHKAVWYEYQAIENVRSGEAFLNVDLFTGCVVEGEAYLVEWNLSSDGVSEEAGAFRWVQSEELQQFRISTDVSYLNAVEQNYTLSATIAEWSNIEEAYVAGQGFSTFIEMPHSEVLAEDLQASGCGVEPNLTDAYEVLNERVYEAGDAFDGAVQVVCPLLNIEYEMWYGLNAPDDGNSTISGTVRFNLTSFNDTSDAHPLFAIPTDERLNTSGEWHFYASLFTYNESTDSFSDLVGEPGSKDIRDLFVVDITTALPDDLDSDQVPFFLDACVNTPAGETVDERGCAFDYDAGDGDTDGVLDKDDHCPGTREGLAVDDEGCEVQVQATSDGGNQWLCIGFSGAFAIAASLAYVGLEWKRRAVRLAVEKGAKVRAADRFDEVEERDVDDQRPPYGWDLDATGSLTPNWDEQAIIDRMVWKRDEDNAPTNELTAWLNRQGIKDEDGHAWTSVRLEATLSNGLHEQRLNFKPPEGWGSEAWHRTDADGWA